jgi:hypothetical protein
MDFGALAETLANLTWRETLIAVIAMLVLYVLVVFFRMQRLKRAKEVVRVAESAAALSAVAAYAAEQAPELPPEPPARVEPEFAWNEPPPEIPGQQMIDALERNVSILRGEVGTLRAELSQMREALQRELSHTRVTQNVSPIYGDAMQMAMQGHDATTISQHCGIARAEAELVVALVRNRHDGNQA